MCKLIGPTFNEEVGFSKKKKKKRKKRPPTVLLPFPSLALSAS